MKFPIGRELVGQLYVRDRIVDVYAIRNLEFFDGKDLVEVSEQDAKSFIESGDGKVIYWREDIKLDIGRENEMTPKMAARLLYNEGKNHNPNPALILASKLRELLDTASQGGTGKKGDKAYLDAVKIIDELEGKK